MFIDKLRSSSLITVVSVRVDNTST
jgi:hypothetical protein